MYIDTSGDWGDLLGIKHLLVDFKHRHSWELNEAGDAITCIHCKKTAKTLPPFDDPCENIRTKELFELPTGEKIVFLNSELQPVIIGNEARKNLFELLADQKFKLSSLQSEQQRIDLSDFKTGLFKFDFPEVKYIGSILPPEKPRTETKKTRN